MRELGFAMAYWENSWTNWRDLAAAPAAGDLFRVAEEEGGRLLLVVPASSLGWPPLVKCGPPDGAGDPLAWLRRQLSAERPGAGAVHLSVGLPPHAPWAEVWRGRWRAEGLLPSPFGRLVLARETLARVPADPEVRLLSREDGELLGEASQVNAQAFGSPVAVSRFFLQPEVVRPYVLQHEGQVVSVGCRYEAAEVAGVYSLATAPRHRHHGFARRLLEAMLADGHPAVLDCLPETVPFYRRSGFTAVARLEEWSGYLRLVP